MTTNAISYLKARIDERHFERSDAETARHNFAVEQLSKEQNEEVKRSNLAREQETHRANVAQETNYYQNLLENMRHNVVTESLTAQDVQTRSERAGFQNLLDSSSATLNQAKVEGQGIANKQDTLNYNLNTQYQEVERVTNPLDKVSVGKVNLGSVVRSAINLYTYIKSDLPAAKPINTKPKLEYIKLNTR